MQDIAIVAYHQSRGVADAGACNEVELIMPVLAEAWMHWAPFRRSRNHTSRWMPPGRCTSRS